jgi:hypothetical protein
VVLAAGDGGGQLPELFYLWFLHYCIFSLTKNKNQMKKLILTLLVALLLFSCGNQKKKDQATANEPAAEVVALTVDQLYENATDMVDKEIVLTGTVMHVCQQGGERCFLMGSNEDINIRVEAGEKIGAFSQELMGSSVEITGVLKEVKTEAEAHNPGQHSGAEAEKTSPETESAHKVIAEAEEDAPVVYFIEGIKAKEL